MVGIRLYSYVFSSAQFRLSPSSSTTLAYRSFLFHYLSEYNLSHNIVAKKTADIMWISDPI